MASPFPIPKTRVRFIDPFFSVRNPSTNGMVALVETLVSEGNWDIEIWGREIDAPLKDKVKLRSLGRCWLPAIAQIYADFLVFHLWMIGDVLAGKFKPHKVISTGFFLLGADIVTIHFSHYDWLKHQVRLGLFHSRTSCREFLKSLPGLVAEVLLFYNPWRNIFLSVSEAVADDIRRWAAPWKEARVLPNAIQHKLFSVARRQSLRDEARKQHQFKTDETVFAYASNGHFYRKGFQQAVEVITILRRRGHRVRLLVIGGREKALERIKEHLPPGTAEETGIIFTGMVPDPGFHFSAADAFFFPSHSEAFSLVEIEAAAHGLPLYLTPHHGSEMILREGVNGRVLPWDPPSMAALLEEELTKGITPLLEPYTGRALGLEEYIRQWKKLLLENPNQKSR